MTRICDICGKPAMDLCYQFAVPSVLTNNDGREFKPVDPSMTDVCGACLTEDPGRVVAQLVAKAVGK